MSQIVGCHHLITLVSVIANRWFVVPCERVAYLPRLADQQLRERLAVIGAVVLEGPKACGKTETARQACVSEVLLDVDVEARRAATIDPSLLLEGAVPRLLDEWQVVPDLWNHVRRVVDQRSAPGQFVLTGSAMPADDQTRHSGAGRFAHVQLRTLTLVELGKSTASVSLGELLDGSATRSGKAGLSLDDLIVEVLRGGWPDLIDADTRHAARWLRDYLDRLQRTDISTLTGIRRDPHRVGALVRSLARHVAGQPSMRTLIGDIAAGDVAPGVDATREYLDALRRLMILEEAPAWTTHLRSRYRLRQRPTVHFVDPSLAASALRATPVSLRADLNTLGLLFESLVIRDLRVYAGLLDAEVFHYRDESDLEVDVIVDAGDRWAAFEVKLGAGQIDAAARTLTTFRDRVDTSRRGEPALLGVIVGTGAYGYVRPDSVHVIPIGALTA